MSFVSVAVATIFGGMIGGAVGAVINWKLKKLRELYFGEFDDNDEEWINSSKGSYQNADTAVMLIIQEAIVEGSVRFHGHFKGKKIILPSYYLIFHENGTITGQEHENPLNNAVTGFYNRSTLKLILKIPAFVKKRGDTKAYFVKTRFVWEPIKNRFVGISWQLDEATGKKKIGCMKLRIKQMMRQSTRVKTANPSC